MYDWYIVCTPSTEIVSTPLNDEAGFDNSMPRSFLYRCRPMYVTRLELLASDILNTFSTRYYCIPFSLAFSYTAGFVK